MKKFSSFTILIYLVFISGQTIGQYHSDSVYYGANNYIEYHAGNLPIIISAPHGGSIEPNNILDRVCSGCVTVKDSWTEELAYKIDSAIQVVFGGSAHVIINKLSRKKLDANREIVEAALGNPIAENAWHEYHDFLQYAKNDSKANFGSALYIDLHAHGHPKQRVELGYLITKTELQLSDGALNALNYQDSSSVKHLKNVLNPSANFSEILRGNDCMGELLHNHGFPCVPSASDPAPLPADPYFSGGYNTARHGSRDSSEINAIQFETNYTGIRNNNANRNAFARGLACVLKNYLEKWYFDLDSWDPGSVVTTNVDSGPGSLRSALLGAEDGDVITFASSLIGDTIRLEKELQVCNNITIEGPGADLLAVSGEGVSRVFRISNRSVAEVSGLSIVNGKTFSGEDGGGLWVNGNLRLARCVLTGNYADDDGGAIAVMDSLAFVQLDSCEVSNNSCGDDGGGLRCWKGGLSIVASTIKGNFSPSYGGGLSSNGNITILSSTFSGNEATTQGGGLRIFGSGLLTVTNSTIVENKSGDQGGGISTSSEVNLDFCSILYNDAANLGGGILISSLGDVVISNSIISGNTGLSAIDISASSGTIVSNDHNFVSDTTGSSLIAMAFDQFGNTASPLNPMTLMLSSNGGPTETVAIQANSTCVDNADNIGGPFFDQRGYLRQIGVASDIGAYEFCIPSSSIDTRVACDSFTWIDGNTYTSNNNIATYTLLNASGCDSTVSLNLTINQVNTSVTQTGNILGSNVSGAHYQWLDCTNLMAPINGDTSQFFSPTSVGNYAVIVSQNGCVDTSACYTVIDLGNNDNDFKESIHLYPNPTSGKVKIELDAVYSSVYVKVSNALGTLVLRSEYSPSQEFDITIVGPSGLYFVEIITAENKQAAFKIVKE